MDAIKQIVAKSGIVDSSYLDSPQGEMYLAVAVASLAVGAALALYLGPSPFPAPVLQLY